MKVPSGLKVMFWVVAAALLIFGVLNLAIYIQGRHMADLEKEISGLKQEFVNLRFSIRERSEESLAVTVKLYDADGEEISDRDIELPGERLFVDFIIVKKGDYYLSFPCRIFSDSLPASEGISLYPDYDESGFPSVFAQKGLSWAARDGLTGLFREVKAGKYGAEIFGDALHDIGGVSEFGTGRVYKAVARLSGGMEIMEDE